MTVTSTGPVKDDFDWPMDFGKSVEAMANNSEFREKHKGKGAPLAMIAFGNEVS